MCKVTARLSALLHEPSLHFDLAQPNRTSCGELLKLRSTAAARAILKDVPKLAGKAQVAPVQVLFMEEYLPMSAQQHSEHTFGLDRETERLQQDLLAMFGQ